MRIQMQLDLNATLVQVADQSELVILAGKS